MKILITGASGFIGTNLISFLIKENIEVVNLDVNKPNVASHNRYWKQCDILNSTLLKEEFINFAPTHVIHLAARTDTLSNDINDYKSNTDGTFNVVEAIKSAATVERVIIISTQFVNQYHGIPKHDEDYAPHTVYGESKVITEQLTRKANLNCTWTIVRPTNIWGPWHPRYAKEFWLVLKKGRYIHPVSKKQVIRSYGYVGNVVHQIIQILKSKKETVDKQVFYLGDFPVDIYLWANGFSLALTGKNVKKVPGNFVRMIAYCGDIFKFFGFSFPITSSRYKSMTTSNDAPMEKTFTQFDKPLYSLQEGIDETVKWLVSQDKDFWSA